MRKILNHSKYLIAIWLLLVVLLNGVAEGKGTVYQVISPDKGTRMEITTREKGELVYRLFYAGSEVITWSPLGFIINNVLAGKETVITIKSKTSHNDRFAWPLGENDTILNDYEEMNISCKSSSFKFCVVARVFNGSAAFRYEIGDQPGFEASSIRKENTQFNFTKTFTVYQYHQESVFTPTLIDSLQSTCDFPATLVFSNQLYMSIGEANNYNYTKAELKRGLLPHSLMVSLERDSVVKMSGSFETPWRTISCSKTAIGLHDCSELFLKLCPPAAAEDLKWIKPGKLIRAQLNTQSGLDCIDFAAKHAFDYIMFDAGWYGAEFRSTSDPAMVIPQIDMPKVIQYGKEKGIGVILYVNYVGLKAKLDTLLPLYKSWGVSGLKFGFVDGLTQGGLTWLSSAIKKTNDYGFIIDIHDNYKPTGLSRTFPALLTQEGIRGDENSPDAFHTTVLPFTRFLAGPADFTFCYPNAKKSFAKNFKVTKAHQLALTVIFFSPLQSMFWYGEPNDYTDEGEIEFFKLVPTVWNETRYLAGEIGENISVARRKGDTWFVGNAAGLNNWKGSVRLDFLSPGKVYTATVFEDDGKGSIQKITQKVKTGDSFSFDIKAKAGQVLLIKPEFD